VKERRERRERGAEERRSEGASNCSSGSSVVSLRDPGSGSPLLAHESCCCMVQWLGPGDNKNHVAVLVTWMDPVPLLCILQYYSGSLPYPRIETLVCISREKPGSKHAGP